MGCPTCSYTMQCIGVLEGRARFWCPRCGTLRMKSGLTVQDEVPKVVDRTLVLIDAMNKVDAADPVVRALCEAATGRPDR